MSDRTGFQSGFGGGAPPSSGERGGRGSRGGRGRGRGGRGGRGGRAGRDGDKEAWKPVTKLGRLVKERKITRIEEIYLHSLPIKVLKLFFCK